MARVVQIRFFKLRQSEFEPYKFLVDPLQVPIGNLASPLYFDFIAFSQYATLSKAIPDAPQVFQVCPFLHPRPLPSAPPPLSCLQLHALTEPQLRPVMTAHRLLIESLLHILHPAEILPISITGGGVRSIDLRLAVW